MNVGIFSGTFDPVHEGHIWLARESLEQFGLDRVVLLPEPRPRRKAPMASYRHRRAMLDISIQDDDKLDVQDIPTDSHGVKSTLEFIEQIYNNPEMTIIMGADVLDNIIQWEDFEYLKERVSFIVCLRKEDDGESALIKASELVIDIQMISSEHSLTSSSAIRNRLSQSETPKGISKDIYSYIMDNKLYESD